MDGQPLIVSMFGPTSPHHVHQPTTLKVIPYSSDYRRVWDQLIDQAANAAVIHYRAYLEYHLHRFAEVSALVFHQDELIAVFPAESGHDQVYSYRGLTFAGLILRKGCSRNLLFQAWKSITNHYSLMGYSQLEIQPSPGFFWKEAKLQFTAEDFVGMGWAQTGMKIYDTVKLPYEIRDRGKLWGIRRAQALGLSVRLAEELDTFWIEILQPNLLKRHDAAPVHSLKEIKQLKSSFPAAIQLWTVSQKGLLLGGCLLYVHGQVVHSQYIASSEEGRKLRCLDLLFAQLIEDFGSSHTYFSLGTSSNPRDGQRDSGLVKWKKSLGAQEIPAFSWKMDLKTLPNGA